LACAFGSLAGTNVLSPAWDPKHIIFSSDPVRYLGILLGIPEKVATAWCADARTAAHGALKRDLTSTVHRSFNEWGVLGVGSTYAGRNLIVKNSVLAKVWYVVESQLIASSDAHLTAWQQSAWRFVEATADALRQSSSNPSRTAHKVARLVLAQDYAEGVRR
jgi:hypothetical protein